MKFLVIQMVVMLGFSSIGVSAQSETLAPKEDSVNGMENTRNLSSQTALPEPLLKSAKNDTLAKYFGIEIQTLIAQNDGQSFQKSFDLASLENRILQASKYLNDENRQEAEKWVEQKALKEFESLPSFVNNLNKTFFDFVYYRFDVFQESYILLFRKYNEENGLDYIEFRLSKREGKLYIDDIYTYFKGQNVSESLASILDFELISKTSDVKNEKVKNDLQFFDEYSLALNQNDFALAYSKLDSIQGPMNKSKNVMLTKVFLASQLDDAKYAKTLRELESQYENDPTVCLALIAYYAYNEDTAKVMKLLSIIENETHDSFLNYLRGSYYYNINDVENANNMLSQIIYEYPNFPYSYFKYINLHIQEKNYDKVVKALNALVRIHIDRTYLIEKLESPDSPKNVQEFTQSPEYQSWKQESK